MKQLINSELFNIFCVLHILSLNLNRQYILILVYHYLLLLVLVGPPCTCIITFLSEQSFRNQCCNNIIGFICNSAKKLGNLQLHVQCRHWLGPCEAYMNLPKTSNTALFFILGTWAEVSDSRRRRKPRCVELCATLSTTGQYYTTVIFNYIVMKGF